MNPSSKGCVRHWNSATQLGSLEICRSACAIWATLDFDDEIKIVNSFQEIHVNSVAHYHFRAFQIKGRDHACRINYSLAEFLSVQSAGEYYFQCIDAFVISLLVKIEIHDQCRTYLGKYRLGYFFCC